MRHIFTKKGLGDAPFKAVDLKGYDPIFCDCCGRMQRPYQLIQSSDGDVSAVNLTCLEKTGDLNLIAGAQRLAKQAAL